MRTPHSFAPHRLATAVVLALSGPSALAADFYVGANSDPGDSDPASLDCSNASNTTCTLSAAIYAANQASGSDTIFLTTDVTLTGIMQRLIDSDMTLDGQGHTIDGGGFRPLFVKSGTVTIKNMTISNGLAQGGSGYYRYDSRNYGGGGGGGAGLGGALFIYSGTVTVRDTTFNANKAQGGLSNTILSGSAGGGGMFGNGSPSGGGLFGNGNGNTGGYGGTSNYNSTNPTFGTGGNVSDTNTNATDGGFGGGGGGGNNCAVGGSSGGGGDGGFGGGGGSSNCHGSGNGGFGGGGGGSGYSSSGVGGYGGGNGGSSNGGGGAGFGGAIFVQRGELTLHNVNFSGNDATGGTGISGVNPGDGRGGAVFICTANLTDSGTNQAPTQCGGSINATSCGVIAANDTASTDQKELFWKGANGNIEFSAIGATQACPVTPTGPTSPIPTLSEWGLLMMSSLLGLFGAWRTRRSHP
ncbi:MAG TPA: IPTL-CTERM sorting domain-containing protein [Candidatus Competibacteraceae bacterium]|nr:IPTL-CTERM sorting domain-containing protein [Candidatus Competibacteraceae bacterium]